MSFTSSSSRSNSIAFIKIELSGKTLRFAQEDVIAKDVDGSWYFWEGRLTGISDVIAGFNDVRDSNSIISNINFDLINGVRNTQDSNLDSDLDTYFWPNSAVTLYLQEQGSIVEVKSQWKVGPNQFAGPGKRLGSGQISKNYEFDAYVLSSSEIVFKGKVSFPDGVRGHSEETVSVSAHDDSYNEQLLLAPNSFKIVEPESDVNFPRGNPGIEGIVIPVIYGDFSDSPIVPAYQVRGFPLSDTFTYKVADSETLASGQAALTSIDQIKSRSIVVSTTATDLSDGDFDVNSSDVIYDPADVFVACKGKTRGTQIASVFGGSSSDLLEHPAEIIYDLLVHRLGVSSSLINESSFTSAKSASSDLKARSFVGSDKLVIEALREISFEFGLDIHNLFGFWYLNQFQFNPETSDLNVTEDDVHIGSFLVNQDPNKIYFNSFEIRFEGRPLDSSYDKSFSFLSLEKKEQHGLVQSFNYEFNWAYRMVDCFDRLGMIASFAMRPIKQVSLRGSFRLWNIQPNSVLNISYGSLSNKKCIVRKIQKGVKDFSTSSLAWIVPERKVRVYASPSQTPPTSYEETQGVSYGILHSDLEIVSGFNDTIEFTTDSPYTAIIDPGYYSSGSALASEIQSKMNDVSTTRTVSVSYNQTSKRFRFIADDGSNFSIEWTSDKELGRSSLGFDTSADDSGSSDYLSDNLAIFDTLDSERVCEYA